MVFDEGMRSHMDLTRPQWTRGRPAQALEWLGARDRGLLTLRRAGRTAIVMPAVFALGDKVIGNPQLASFAAFGAFAMLLLVDFRGSMGDRLRAQASLAVAAAVLVCLGTLASGNPWLAAAAMAVVGFAVLFSGVVSSVLAGASTSLALAFILSVTLPGSLSSIPDRLAGWGLASVVGLAAVALLWPAPSEDRLRAQTAATCRALAARLTTQVASLLAVDDGAAAAAHERAVTVADASLDGLQRYFLATPYRPTGLSTTDRAVVRLVDELNWLNAVLGRARPTPNGTVNRPVCAVKTAVASVLDQGAQLLEQPRADPEPLRAALARLDRALDVLERKATGELPVLPSDSVDVHGDIRGDIHGDGDVMAPERADEFLGSLDPSFRAQELSFVAAQIGRNIDLAAEAERRTWLQRLLGHRTPGLSGTLSAAQERAVAHIEPHSLWLRNSVRGAVGLALAVLVADLTGVQHSFWVVLGTLSVLRSNALNTGQNAMRAVLGTAVGFAIGTVLLAPIGSDTTVLWFLLPLAILVAGIAPAAISFAAGQAGFTLVLVILFNIVQPTGWRVGLVRVEDIALGCVVSLLVGLLFWPRGAAAALSKALAEAYTDSTHYLAAAVEFGVRRCDSRAPGSAAPTDEAVRAAAAARRMDDTFRGYLAERGAKTVHLAEVTRLVTGVVGLRLAADAVLDLWERNGSQAAGGDRTAARAELLRTSASITGWYDDLADSLDGLRPVPEPLVPDRRADARLVQAVGRDLHSEDGNATATAVRMIWTSDHLDAVRRLQASLIDPTLAAAHGDRRRARREPVGPVSS